ncbi:DUF1656 domain-containing protein (plasmid) [Tistrella mobilis]|jgi:hypothetical protein|uniref:DUF1656 domain-containing protein n=1 Tax=Tistrella mobilis TaxID=171437 RepID=UPI00355839E1
MIVDADLGGVFVPGLLVLALLALAATLLVIRILVSTGLSRRFAGRPFVELAVFAIIYGLLVQYLPSTGLLQ